MKTAKPRRRKLKTTTEAEALAKMETKHEKVMADKRTKEHRTAVMSGQLKALHAEVAQLRKTNKALATLCLAYLEKERDA